MLRGLEGLGSDLRIALRGFRRAPGFTTTAVVILALGLGANTAIFNLVNTVLLRTIPAAESHRLVALSTVDSGGRPGGFSYADFEEIRRHQRVFSSIFAWGGAGIISTEAEGAIAPAAVTLVTPDYYSVLGIRPLRGQTFGSGAEPVAVLSYRCWQSRYGGRNDAIGRTIRIEGHSYTVAGVMPSEFRGYSLGTFEDVTVSLPAWYAADEYRQSPRRRFEIVGRLRPGLSIEQAREQLQALWPSVLAATLPSAASEEQRKEHLDTRLDVSRGDRGGTNDYVRRRYARSLLILMGAVGLTLLIACANLAGLLLSRAAARAHDTSVRLALGAGRWRLLRQMTVEGMLLSLPAVIAGGFLGAWLSRVLADFMWIGVLPHDFALTPDFRVYVFMALAATAAGVLAGAAPAWQVPRQAPATILYGVGRSGASRKQGIARVLVAAQAALAMVLLTAAGLFGASLRNVRAFDLGFDSESVLTAQLGALPNGYDGDFAPVEYYPRLLERMRATPGVRSATLSRTVPIMPPPFAFNYTERVAAAATRAEVHTYRLDVAPQFLETFGIPLMRGRSFTLEDREASGRVAMISRSLATALFPSGDAIGQRIAVGTAREWQNVAIVGIAGDAALWNVREHHARLVYLPLLQQPDRLYSPMLEVRAAGPAEGVANDVRRIIAELGHEYPLAIRPLKSWVDVSLVQERLMAILSGFFGLFPLILACVGLYGLVSFSVSRRTAEIGVRMAVGAGRARVLRMVLGESLAVVAMGCVAGIPLALIAARFARGMVYDISPADPRLLALAVVLLALAGTLAALIPALRATRISPMSALRAE
jgi:predicted permease